MACFGSLNGRARLTADDVRLIRQLYPELSQRVLAKKFDISKRAIEAVVTRQTWRHVE
jgi:hypothetical protein